MSQPTHNILRAQRANAYYKAQANITIGNKQRTLGKHIRHFPEDLAAQKVYTARYKAASLTGHLASPTAKARWREHLREREAKRVAALFDTRLSAPT